MLIVDHTQIKAANSSEKKEDEMFETLNQGTNTNVNQQRSIFT